MSQPTPKPDAPDPETARLRRELEEKILLIQDIRKALIHSQITVLELNDTIMRKETEKIDALAILTRLEGVLEDKLNHIAELDRGLNQKIATLQDKLAAETGEKTARDQIINDLVQKLDAANREIGTVHTLAGDYARDLAQARAQLQRTATELTETQTSLAATQQDLASTTAARDALDREVTGMRAALTWRLTAPFRALRRLFS
jgi:chromosome segregation ATPase